MSLWRSLRQPGYLLGVINLVYVSGPDAGEVIFSHPEFAGLHFTGSTGVFRMLWRTIANNLENYGFFFHASWERPAVKIL